jgi:hypothetical protein
VAERVTHRSHEPPGICLNISLEAGTRHSRVANRDLDVLDHKNLDVPGSNGADSRAAREWQCLPRFQPPSLRDR